MKLRIGTRGSQLALAQTGMVAAALASLHSGLKIETVVIRTTGDQTTDLLTPALGVGFFTSQLEQALQQGRIDLAVHSLKDLPTALGDGLLLAAVSERVDPRDALVSPLGDSLAALPAGTRIGTASIRRKARILQLRPDLQPIDLRGNVDSRLSKLESGFCGAIVVARAGLIRLGRTVGKPLSLEEMLPAPAQGALGLEVRSDDEQSLALVAVLDDPATRAATMAERSTLHALHGGCQIPLGCLAQVSGERLSMQAMLLETDGSGSTSATLSGPTDQAQALGAELALRLTSPA